MGGMMVLKKVLFVSILIFCIILPLKSNPILEWYFNELQVDSSGWRMELIVYAPTLFNNYYLTSQSHTAFFKPGLNFLPEYCVITEDSLSSMLYVNPVGDSLCFYDSSQIILDELVFGNILTSNHVPEPPLGHSISLYADPVENEYFWYLDKSPTFGVPNDTANAMGFIEGFVSDTAGIPLPDVEVIYGYLEILGIVYPKLMVTDSLGYFKLRDYAKWSSLEFKKNNFMSVTRNFLNWPDSTVTLDVTMTPLVDIDGNSAEFLPDKFKLLQNYPNPFNNETIIEFYLPYNTFIELSIYNILAENIRTLYKDKISGGHHYFRWDGLDNTNRQVPSGVYFYQLHSGQEIITKKMFLLK
jgi:hypothetical protein